MTILDANVEDSTFLGTNIPKMFKMKRNSSNNYKAACLIS